MKKYLVEFFAFMVVVALSQSIAHAKDANVKAYCNSVYQEGSRGFVNIPTKHGATIINKSASTLVYDVYYDNYVQYPKLREMPVDYTEAPYTHNAHAEHHIAVSPGQTLYFGEHTLEKLAGFIHRGTYKTKATTIILLNGSLLGDCEYFNNVFIY